MKFLEIDLRWLSDIFGSETKPVNWPRLQDQVEASVKSMNGSLSQIGSIARFVMLKKEAGLEIYLNRAEYSPEAYLADTERQSRPEIEAYVDPHDGLGLMLPHNPGPRPAGMTRKHLSETQAVAEIGRNLRHSLNHADWEKLHALGHHDKSLRAFGFE